MRQHASPWLLLSASLHLCAGLAMLPAREPARAARPLHPLEIAVIVTENSTSDAAPSAPAVEDAIAPEPPRDARRPGRASRPARRAPVPPEPTPSGPRAEAAPDEATVAPSLQAPSLSPRTAALTLLEGSMRGSDAAPDAAPPGPSPSEKLDEAIAKGAARRVDRPPDPVLKPGKKGGYVYQGNGFDATIDPNGDLHVKDRYGEAHVPLVPFQSADGKWHIAILGGSFRLYEWLDRKIGKNDPYYSERRWFLERTRALRERLAREHAPHMRDEPE